MFTRDVLYSGAKDLKFCNVRYKLVAANRKYMSFKIVVGKSLQIL